MPAIDIKNYQIQIGSADGYYRQHFSGKYRQIFVIVDEFTKRYCLPIFTGFIGSGEFVILEIPSGEKNKQLDTCRLIWDFFLRNQADKQDLVINLGGGYVCDIGGFCASTYFQGLDFIHIPTTLLAQVDASIGGRLGIDYDGYKNLLGVFADPQAVLIEFNFLESLPIRILKSGFVEIIKYSLIGSPAMWENLRNEFHFNAEFLYPLIEKSLLIKKQFVEKDPFEKGERKNLLFGQTIGHAIESHFINTGRHITYGECVAIGLICESYISRKVYEKEERWLLEISSGLEPFIGPLSFGPEEEDKIMHQIIPINDPDVVTAPMTLIREIGHPEFGIEVSENLIRECLTYFRENLC